MPIITDEKILRMPCTDVLPEEVGELRELLERELANSSIKGVGLALPQIGVHKKMAIVRPGQADKNIDLVNATIIKGYDEQIFRSEGCLSFPGRVEDTMRYQEVHIANSFIYPNNFIATGLLAVICAHELDHLNNILLPDRAIQKEIKLAPNAPCYCGSKKKFKRCCYLLNKKVLSK